MKSICSVVVIATVITLCSGSAIPMWEFLSRGEKMSHLYSMFAKQVSSYCRTNIDVPVAQCKRDLLVLGVDKLEKMSDSYLDAMDPYQRGANDIIWDSMMEGHRSKPSKKAGTTQSPIREPAGQYERNPLFDDDRNNEHDDKQNEASHTSSVYAMGMDNMYNSYNYPTAIESMYGVSAPQNHLVQEAAATNLHLNFDYPAAQQSAAITSNFLSGPMIIRVRPDGTPVEEDKLKPLPRDDDREAMTLGKNRIPTVQQIAQNFDGAAVQPAASSRRTVFASYRTSDRRGYNSH